MLLVVLGEPLLKEGSLYRELAMLISHRKDRDGFLSVYVSKKNIIEPSISKFASCFDTVTVFFMKHLFSTTSAAGTIVEL